VVASFAKSWLDVGPKMVLMEKPMEKVSADHQGHTFSAASAIAVMLKGASAIVLTVACFALFCYGALAVFDWLAG
jgi:hypothetical protein